VNAGVSDVGNNDLKPMKILTSAIVTIAILTAGTVGTSAAEKEKSAAKKSESSTSSQPQAASQNSRASELLKAKVKSQDGQEFGAAEDLIVDNSSGKIQFVVIGQGGALGVNKDLIPVPWTKAKVGQNEDNEPEINLQVSAQKLHSAPALQKDYSNLNDPQFAHVVKQFFTSGPSATSNGDGQHGSAYSATNGMSAMGGSEGPEGAQLESGSANSSTNENAELQDD